MRQVSPNVKGGRYEVGFEGKIRLERFEALNGWNCLNGSAVLFELRHHSFGEQPDALQRHLMRHAAELKSPGDHGELDCFAPFLNRIDAVQTPDVALHQGNVKIRRGFGDRSEATS